MTLTVND